MFDIDLQSRTPIYEQLYKRVVELTVKKQLRPGDKLPSVRELAKALGVNPNTVSKAFQNLERDGMIYSLPGRGSFISDKNGDVIKQNAAEQFTLAAKEAAAAGLTAEEMTEIIRKITETGGNKID
ncbi:MAG: GntR family transcriptional regulator [Oscillospiraceae bacterium]|nr:GntR family transcriptional regulator [Oscillospiraceae bacterium]